MNFQAVLPLGFVTLRDSVPNVRDRIMLFSFALKLMFFGAIIVLLRGLPIELLKI